MTDREFLEELKKEIIAHSERAVKNLHLITLHLSQDLRKEMKVKKLTLSELASECISRLSLKEAK